MQLLLGDCLDRMKEIPDKSVDMVLCDLPYGTTALKWDVVIPFDEMWEQVSRVTKERSAICLFGSEPFSSALRVSNKEMYRYDWIWEKSRATLFQHANKMPMKKHEIISVFYKKLPTYNPQFTEGKPYKDNRTLRKGLTDIVLGGIERVKSPVDNPGRRYPVSIIDGFCDFKDMGHHPTQKPVPLLQYLIKTYTNPGETVLDFTMGSGSTGVAAKNLGRNFIGIERDESYFEIAKKRIEAAGLQEVEQEDDGQLEFPA